MKCSQTTSYVASSTLRSRRQNQHRWRVDKRCVTTLSASHEGIVPAAVVHESSLQSMGLAPSQRDTAPLSNAKEAQNWIDKWSSLKSERVIFRTSATCPFAHRVWLALTELGVKHELVFENLEDKSAEFKAQYFSAAVDVDSNPSVPILSHRGTTMVESALVLKYIATAFDGGNNVSLIPADPVQGYYGQLFADTFQLCVPLYFKMLRATNQDDLDLATQEFIAGLKRANRALVLGAATRRGGVYSCGSQFTTYDIMPMTFVPRFEIVLAHYRGFNLRMALKENQCAALESWIVAVSARPSLLRTLKEIEKVRETTIQEAFVQHFAKFVSWQG